MNSEQIEVQHWSGAGNRFVIIDNRNKYIQHISEQIVSRLCRRINLLDAEGLLVLTETNNNDLSCNYDFYNPNGSTGMMCGNGARCAIRHAITITGWNVEKIQLILNKCRYEGQLIGSDLVSLHLPSYRELRIIDNWAYVNVGSEHIVIDAQDLVSSLDEFHRFPLNDFAREHLDIYRNQVARVSLNLNIAFLDSQTNLIHLRTYENGVFDETQACGTGAISTALAFWKKQRVHHRSIDCLPKSNRMLTVDLELDESQGQIVGIILRGDAREDTISNRFDLKTMEYQ